MLLQDPDGVDRDYHLTTKDIADWKDKLDGLEWKYEQEQAQSIREFIKANPDLTLCYKEFKPPSSSTSGDDFMLGITTPELMDVAVKYGHNRLASMDSTFATNNLKASFQVWQCKPIAEWLGTDFTGSRQLPGSGLPCLLLCTRSQSMSSDSG